LRAPTGLSWPSSLRFRCLSERTVDDWRHGGRRETLERCGSTTLTTDFSLDIVLGLDALDEPSQCIC
jgi:hypothetical protein